MNKWAEVKNSDINDWIFSSKMKQRHKKETGQNDKSTVGQPRIKYWYDMLFIYPANKLGFTKKSFISIFGLSVIWVYLIDNMFFNNQKKI